MLQRQYRALRDQASEPEDWGGAICTPLRQIELLLKGRNPLTAVALISFNVALGDRLQYRVTRLAKGILQHENRPVRSC